MLKKDKPNHKTIDEYIAIAKSDIYVYIVVTILVFIGLLYISSTTNCYIYLLFNMVMLIFTADKIYVYFNLNKIKKYLIQNNLIDKIGTIEYWNEMNYFLTNNYMIISYKNKIYCLKYSDISTIYKETRFNNGEFDSIEKYLHLLLNDGEEIEILIWSSALRTEEFKDISDYLLNKNPNIKVIKKKAKFNILKFLTIK
ncbi:MAG: hypothetical protein HFH45_03905 [Bacilli bacterium]|nr:hypothetical protein [Bacilli bacterium]